MQIVGTTVVRTIVTISLLAAGVSNANAVIVTGSGVDVVRKHYVIDDALSSVSYNSGEIIFGSEDTLDPINGTYSISGSFDVDFEHHWWTYYMDGDTEGTQGTFLFSTDWLRFVNPAVSANGLPAGFEFPTFPSNLSSPREFSGSNDVCALPMGPDTFCSGNSTGGISSLAGLLQDGKIVFDGHQPNELYLFGGGYTYHVEATVVPVPAAFWLFASILGFWGIRPKFKIA